MTRHLSMLIVATLFVGGCHRNKPASKAARATNPVRSSSPKEVKPAVISITPVPFSKPVLVPPLKKERLMATQDSSGSVPKAQSTPVASGGLSVKRSEETKLHQPLTLSAPVSKTGHVDGVEARESGKESPQSLADATAEARMPWERPLYEPSSAKGKKVKSDEAVKFQGEKAKQVSAVEARSKAREIKLLVPTPTDKSSAPESETAHKVLSDTETPAVAAQEIAQTGPIVAETTASQPEDTVSGSSKDASREVSAEVPKLAPKKSSRSQAPRNSAASPAVMESTKAEETPVVAAAAVFPKPLEPTRAAAAPAQFSPASSIVASSSSVSESDSSAGTFGATKPSVEVAKDSMEAQKIAAVVPKKLSEVERKEAVRKQANDSYHSGQQLIRESRNTEAMQALKQTVKLAPESADAWLRIAYLLEREGKLDEARRAFKEAKKFWAF